MNSSSANQQEDEDEFLEEEEESHSSESKSLWNVIWYIIATLLGGFVFMGRSSPLRYLFSRLFSNSSSSAASQSPPLNNSSSFFDKLFASPFLDDDERVRLRPISVNSYVHVYPTLQNEDGVFVKVFIENSSELATENV